MKVIIIGIIISAIFALGLQMILPFPYGIISAIVISFVIIFYAKRRSEDSSFSLRNYRRADPKNSEELEQNKEAYRILKKRFLEGQISKEEFEKLRKGFDIKDD